MAILVRVSSPRFPRFRVRSGKDSHLDRQTDGIFAIFDQREVDDDQRVALLPRAQRFDAPTRFLAVARRLDLARGVAPANRVREQRESVRVIVRRRHEEDSQIPNR